MNILNLYAGLGGNRQLWGDEHNITSIEYDRQTALHYKKLYPKDKIIICDAMDFLLNNYKDYDFIWASPPCPTHSRVRITQKNTPAFLPVFPDMSLWQIIIFLKHHFKKLWVVENVKPYYKPLIEPAQELQNHLFWANFAIKKSDLQEKHKHTKIEANSTVYGINLANTAIKNKRQALRNLVNPCIGKHILEQAKEKK